MSARLLDNYVLNCMVSIVTIHLNQSSVDYWFFNLKPWIFPVLVESYLFLNLHNIDYAP